MESFITPPRMLTDVRFVRLSLAEGSSDGKIRVKGEFAKCGVATENKRVYPEGVWNKEIGRLNTAMTDRRVYGEMDHPTDGRTSLGRVSHIVTNLKVTKDGLVEGEAEVLPTEAGKNLSALLAAGCKVGVSSRGYGSTKSNEKGEEVVQPDYKLVTFDFVAEPADSDAYPDLHTESKNLIFEGVEMTAEQEKEKAASWAKKIMGGEGNENADVRDDFARDMLATIVQLKTEAREEVRASLLADPEFAGAQGIIEKVKELFRPFMLEGDAKSAVAKLTSQLAERDLRIKTLEDENQKLAEVAKEVGYKFWMERAVSSDPDADLIRKAVGDVKQFPRVDDLKAKVESVRAELAKKREEAKAVQEARQKEIDAVTAKVEAEKTKLSEEKAKAEAKSAKLEESLKTTLQSEKILGLRLYAEQRLTNHPRAAKIRPLVESAKFSTTAEIDEMIESYREPARDPDDLEKIRSRVRKHTNGGDEEMPLHEDRAPSSRSEGGKSYNGLGMDLASLRKLSGMTPAK